MNLSERERDRSHIAAEMFIGGFKAAMEACRKEAVRLSFETESVRDGTAAVEMAEWCAAQIRIAEQPRRPT